MANRVMSRCGYLGAWPGITSTSADRRRSYVPSRHFRNYRGRAVAQGFRGTGLGETLHFAQRDWVVVGILIRAKPVLIVNSGVTASK